MKYLKLFEDFNFRFLTPDYKSAIRGLPTNVLLSSDKDNSWQRFKGIIEDRLQEVDDQGYHIGVDIIIGEAIGVSIAGHYSEGIGPGRYQNREEDIINVGSVIENIVSMASELQEHNMEMGELYYRVFGMISAPKIGISGMSNEEKIEALYRLKDMKDVTYIGMYFQEKNNI